MSDSAHCPVWCCPLVCQLKYVLFYITYSWAPCANMTSSTKLEVQDVEHVVVSYIHHTHNMHK